MNHAMRKIELVGGTSLLFVALYVGAEDLKIPSDVYEVIGSPHIANVTKTQSFSGRTDLPIKVNGELHALVSKGEIEDILKVLARKQREEIESLNFYRKLVMGEFGTIKASPEEIKTLDARWLAASVSADDTKQMIAKWQATLAKMK